MDEKGQFSSKISLGDEQKTFFIEKSRPKLWLMFLAIHREFQFFGPFLKSKDNMAVKPSNIA